MDHDPTPDAIRNNWSGAFEQKMQELISVLELSGVPSGHLDLPLESIRHVIKEAKVSRHKTEEAFRADQNTGYISALEGALIHLRVYMDPQWAHPYEQQAQQTYTRFLHVVLTKLDLTDEESKRFSSYIREADRKRLQ